VLQRCNGAEARLREPPAGIEPATLQVANSGPDTADSIQKGPEARKDNDFGDR